jgi:hypothetical protein
VGTGASSPAQRGEGVAPFGSKFLAEGLGGHAQVVVGLPAAEVFTTNEESKCALWK